MLETEAWPLLVLVVTVVLVWFFVGTQWNVRKGDTVLKWLNQGLPLVGERTTMRWLGSSVLELKIAKGKDPFRSAETLVAFEPRDIGILWALARLRGRRDTLIFRSQLRSAPKFEMQIFDPQGWTTRNSDRGLVAKGWSPIELPPASSLKGYGSSRTDVQAILPLIDLAERAGGKLVKLAVQRTVPNLEVQWVLPDTAHSNGRELFARLRDIGQNVLEI